MTGGGRPPAAAPRRLDQWLWFARLAKSRSLAARLCIAGAVTVNGITAGKANHPVRVGDAIVLQQRAVQRIIRVLALGTRRGPPSEARGLFEEIAAPARLSELAPAWTPLLADDGVLSDPF